MKRLSFLLAVLLTGCSSRYGSAMEAVQACMDWKKQGLSEGRTYLLYKEAEFDYKTLREIPATWAKDEMRDCQLEQSTRQWLGVEANVSPGTKHKVPGGFMGSSVKRHFPF